MAQAIPADIGATPAPPRSRLRIGAGILVAALLVKIIGPALIVGSDLPSAWKTGLTVALFVIVPKILIVSIVMVVGKSGFAHLKSVIHAHVRRAAAPLAPPQQVSPVRYRIGLVIFTLAILEGLLMPYLERAFPGMTDHPAWDWIADLALILSIFILGGHFWDKLRAPYVHGATVQFPPRQAE
jgi:hypothetical protein